MKKLSKEYTNYLIAGLTKLIVRSGIKYDVVVGVANGGLNISIPVAKSLKVPHQSVKIRTYGPNNTKTHLQIENIDYTPENFKKPLLVDDIIDSGDTCRLFFKYFGQADVAALYYKEHSIIVPTFYVMKTNEWIEFFWE